VNSDPSPYKTGHWIVLGTIMGAFLGLLFGKFAIGLIFGFFVGIAIDSRKRKAAAAPTENPPSSEDTPGP